MDTTHSLDMARTKQTARRLNGSPTKKDWSAERAEAEKEAAESKDKSYGAEEERGVKRARSASPPPPAAKRPHVELVAEPTPPTQVLDDPYPPAATVTRVYIVHVPLPRFIVYRTTDAARSARVNTALDALVRECGGSAGFHVLSRLMTQSSSLHLKLDAMQTCCMAIGDEGKEQDVFEEVLPTNYDKESMASVMYLSSD